MLVRSFWNLIGPPHKARLLNAQAFTVSHIHPLYSRVLDLSIILFNANLDLNGPVLVMFLSLSGSLGYDKCCWFVVTWPMTPPIAAGGDGVAGSLWEHRIRWYQYPAGGHAHALRAWWLHAVHHIPGVLTGILQTQSPGPHWWSRRGKEVRRFPRHLSFRLLVCELHHLLLNGPSVSNISFGNVVCCAVALNYITGIHLSRICLAVMDDQVLVSHSVSKYVK